MKPCGTSAAYNRHLREGEAPCQPCREANKKHCANRYKQRMQNDPELVRKHGREAARRRRTQDPIGESRRAREKGMLSRYGITEAQRAEIIEFQGGICPMCAAENPDALDHNHETGQIRGVPCNSCNTRLGRNGDNAESVAVWCALQLHYLAEAGDHPSSEVVEALTAVLKRAGTRPPLGA